MAEGNADRSLGPDRLTALLRARRPGVSVSSVGVLNESSGSANRLRLAVEYDSGRDAGLPATMFIKRNLAEFNFPGEMYSTEVRIYRDVLDGMSIERPAVYAIESDDSDLEFTIAMEDLGSRPGARLGIVTEPVTPDDVAGLLDTVATLHAQWWGTERVTDALPWLTAAPSNPQMSFWRKIGPRLATRHMERGHRAGLVDRSRWTDEALWNGFDRLIELIDDGPHTLLHGDVHAGNVYYNDGDRGGLIDWQLALRGCWALDVTYLLITALDPDQRAEHERPLIDHYLGQLAAHGVATPSSEQAWRRYRGNVLYGVLMWLITPDGVHTDEAQIGYLSRCLAAAEGLDTLGALGL